MPALQRRSGLLLLTIFLGACATSQPAWISDPYRDYPKARYVVAVGAGHTVDAARQDAMKGIAAFFGVEITAQTGLHERGTSEVRNGRSVDSSSQLEAEESIRQLISGRLSSVSIEKAHTVGETTYVLALLDKPVFLAGLAEEADNVAGALGEGIKTASATSSPTPSMLTNLQTIAQRLDALQSRIRTLGGSVSPVARTQLKDCVVFLARFDITIVTPPSPPPSASAGIAVVPGPLCDSNDPRLRKAVADTAALVGHPVQFHFNLAQLPKSPSFCDDLFERYIGIIPKDLAGLARRRPVLLAYGGPALKVIDFDYDGTAALPSVTFERSLGRARIVMTSRVGYLIPDDVLSYVFEKDYEAWVIAHFEGVEPNKVARTDYPLYFNYLAEMLFYGRTKPRGARAQVSKEEELAQDVPAVAVARMVRFAPFVAGDAELAGKVTNWLVERYEYFGRSYLHHPAEVQKAPADSPWKRAERAWIDWMNASFDQLPDQKKAVLVDIFTYTMPFNNDEGIVWNDFAYPGLKTYEMGLRIIDQWRAAGHPVASSKSRGEPMQALYDKTVSPIQRNSQGYRSVEVFERRKNWYFHALRTDELKRRLLGDILSRKDEVFTETAFANLLRVNDNIGRSGRHERKDDWQDFLFFWRGIESDEKQWRIATRVLAEQELRGDTKRAIYDESIKIWRHNPRVRGALLYLLARGSSPADNMIPWDQWAHVTGAEISAKELADFLDMDTQAMSALPTIWRALGRGYSKGDLVASRLNGFVNDARTRARNFQDPTHSILEVVHRLREEGAAADLAKIHAFLKQRVADHPSEQREFETLLDLTKK